MSEYILRMAITLALVALARAQTGDAEKKLCVAEGKLINAASGEPVVRAMVTIRPVVQTNDPESQPAGFAMETDEAGTFHFAKLAPGKYSLSAQKAGYLISNYGAHRANGPGIPVDLQPGDDRSGLDIKMAPEAVITGTVTDDHGEPANFCNVQLLKRGWMNGRSGLMNSSNAYTDNQGSFRLARIGPGKYYLRADCRQGMMSGGRPPLLVDREGNPIRAQPVSTYYGDATSLEAASLLSVQPGQELSVNIRLRREPVFHIHGKIVSLPAGNSPLNYYIYLMPRTTVNFYMWSGGARPRRDGTFELENVQPGPYQIAAMRNAGRMTPLAIPIEVGAADIDNLEVAIPSPIELQGKVRVEGQPSNELSAIQIRLVAQNGMFGPSAVVSPDGSFKTQDVMLDRYGVSVQFPGETAFVKSVRIGEKEMPDKSIDLTQGAGPVDILLSLYPAKLEVSVTRVDPDSQQAVPAAAVNIALVPEIRTQDFTGGVRTGSTDKDGRYTFKSLEPGKYRAFAADGIDFQQWADPEVAKALESRGVEFEVSERDSKTIQLKLITAEEAAQVLERLGL